MGFFDILNLVHSDEITGYPELFSGASQECGHFSVTGLSSKNCAAFTLSEVLITLGIIGIVAAMTMPAVINDFQKKTAEARLKKFYSVMSQAVLRWHEQDAIEEGNYLFPDEAVRNSDYLLNWYSETIGKYIQSTSVEKDTSDYIKVAFADGSGFVAYVQLRSLLNIFYCIEYKYCKAEDYDGRRTFLFSIQDGKLYTSHAGYALYTRAQLLAECKNPYSGSKKKRHACTRLIHVDGWQINDDYPW